MNAARWIVSPVEDVHDCGLGRHARYIASWDVCTLEGDRDDNFDNEADARKRADELNADEAEA